MGLNAEHAKGSRESNYEITSMREAAKILGKATVKNNLATPRSRLQIMEDVGTCKQITYCFALIHRWNKE